MVPEASRSAEPKAAAERPDVPMAAAVGGGDAAVYDAVIDGGGDAKFLPQAQPVSARSLAVATAVD